MADQNQQQMLSDFAALPDTEKQKVVASLPDGHILKDFAALPANEQQKIMTPAPTGANTTRSDNPNVPLVTPLAGESFADTMKRAVNMGKEVTPQQIAESEKGAGKKAATVLATAPLVGPAMLTAGAIAPEAASTAVGGGIAGGAAAGATGAGLTTALVEPFTGVNPVSKQGATEIGKQTLIGGLTGGLLSAGGKLVDAVASKAPGWWDAVTGYSKALDEAKNANLSRYMLAEQKGAQAVAEGQANVAAVKAAQPQGQIGNWSDLNQSIGTSPAKSLRIGRGASDVEAAYGLPGRGLEAEGFTKEILQKMTPTEQAAVIGPRFQAAGKAVQGIADKATEQGVTLDAGQSTFKVITDRIKDPSLQEKAIEIINSHQRELGITNMRQATPTQALALRQALKNDASFGPTATTDSLRGVGRALYSAVSNDLHNAVPGMKEVDMHYGDLAQTMDVVRGQIGKYMTGKWAPPPTSVQKAEQAVPEMPNVSAYTPLPSQGAFNLSALKKIAEVIGIGGGTAYGLNKLLALRNMPTP